MAHNEMPVRSFRERVISKTQKNAKMIDINQFAQASYGAREVLVLDTCERVLEFAAKLWASKKKEILSKNREQIKDSQNKLS